SCDSRNLPWRVGSVDGDVALVSGAVLAVGGRDESVHRIPDRKGSRWGRLVPLELAADAFPTRQLCLPSVVAVRNDLIQLDSFRLLLDFEMDEIAILGELAN